MIKIEQKALEVMIGDAVNSFPDECCGFIFGREEGQERFITEVQIVHNAKEGDKRRRFEVAPKDYMKAERFADEGGLQLLGVYHSHPNHPALPSEHDRLAAQPYFSYIIISVQDKEFADIRSWRLDEKQQFEEEYIRENSVNN